MNHAVEYKLSHEFSGREKELFLFLLNHAMCVPFDEHAVPLATYLSYFDQGHLVAKAMANRVYLASCDQSESCIIDFIDEFKDVLKGMMLFVRFVVTHGKSKERGAFSILGSIIIRGDKVCYKLTPMFLKKLSDPIFTKFFADAGLLVKK
ncbi:hypothetical protein JST56_07785 [Candidatus Dependentiae bacterium]|nr:hypothetical protein [Candidatus Dependentiae bacterium]